MGIEKIFNDANAYDETSVLARAVGEHMLARLELMAIKPKRIVDAGCGTGYCAALLKKSYPAADIIALDTSLPMLQFAQQQHLFAARWVCADTATLPLPNSSVDFIFANFLLPWCDDLQNVLREWRHVLKPEGLLMFTSLGPDTLNELQQQSVLLPHLMDMHDIGDGLVRAGFADPVMDVEYVTLTYRDAKKLFYETYVTGMLRNDHLDISLEKNADGVFSLTHEVIYGHAWGTEVTSTDESGVIKIPLSQLRGRSSGF